MAYSKQTWIDDNAAYPVSAARMGVIEQGVFDAAATADQGHRILTTAQRDALGAVTAGTMIYNTTTQQMQVYIGSGWVPIGGTLVFTNEAARDAAITSPSEGMVAYLTAPTVPAAGTAETALVPSGVTTIYNGSVWVCVTPVGGNSPTSGTTTSTSFVTTLTSGTGISVTLVTGTTALVHMASAMVNNGASVTRATISVSGATTLAASDANSIEVVGTSQVTSGRSFILSGLTAGTNTFTMNYRVGAGTGTYTWKTLAVQGVA